MQDHSKPLNILIVEDNPGDAWLLEEMLRSAKLSIGHIMVADRITRAEMLLQKEMIDVILVDLSLTDLNGINSVQEITAITKNTPLVILSGLHHTAAVVDSLKQSALDYLYKHELNTSLLAKAIEYSIERKKAEEKLHAAEEKYKQIIEAGFRTQENERKAIGEELHDNINQVLGTVMLFLDASLKEENKRELFILKGLDHVKMAIDEIRKLSNQLVMPNLREFSLRKNIVDLIENIGMASRITIELDLDHLNESALSDEHKVNIYRIVQEQLNNIIRHSAASSATISIRTINGQVNLLITDDGIGYDTQKRRQGIGISNIISRAELFNGKVEIDSSNGNGCLLKVILRNKMESPQKAA